MNKVAILVDGGFIAEERRCFMARRQHKRD